MSEDYVPKSKRGVVETKKPGITRIFDGLLLVIKGHPPSGEKPEVVWYGFNEDAAKKDAAKKEAIANSAYVSTDLECKVH